MKRILFILLLFVGSIGMAQEQKPTIEKKGDLYEATYYHTNGEVAQHGFFNTEGKLQGTWKSYDFNGNKVAIGNYNNGKKVGKWLFWAGDQLTEVDYKNHKMINVHQWSNKTQLAITD